MNIAYECPECGTHDTKKVHVEWMTDMLEEVRICNECPAQFTNKYDLFDQETDSVGEPA